MTKKRIIIPAVLLALILCGVALMAMYTCTGKTDGNILPNHNGLVKPTNGIVYICRHGEYHIVGKTKKAASLTILGSKDTIPDEFVPGDIWYISFDSGSDDVFLGIKAYTEDDPDGVWLLKTTTDAEFFVPDLSAYTGMAVKLNVMSSDAKHDLVLSPKVMIEDKRFEQSMLTIIDDDGDMHFLTDIVPLMQRENISISSAVTTTRIGSEDRWMDWDDIEACRNAGAEILCHTYHHYSGDEIASVEDHDIIEAYKTARDTLLKKGYSGGNILVYSSSTGNIKRVREDAAEVFSCGIKIGGNTVNTPYTNPYALNRFRIDYASTEGREDWDYSDLRSYVDRISENGGWGIFMFHSSKSTYRQRVECDPDGKVIRDENGKPKPMFDEHGDPVYDIDGSYPTMGSTVYVPMLESVIDYAKEKGIKIASAEEAYEFFYAQ